MLNFENTNSGGNGILLSAGSSSSDNVIDAFDYDFGNRLFLLTADGKLRIPEYGSGTFTGTATKWLAVDASGNIIEEDEPGIP